jgi:hypothetical protein
VASDFLGVFLLSPCPNVHPWHSLERLFLQHDNALAAIYVAPGRLYEYARTRLLHPVVHKAYNTDEFIAEQWSRLKV